MNHIRDKFFLFVFCSFLSYIFKLLFPLYPQAPGLRAAFVSISSFFLFVCLFFIAFVCYSKASKAWWKSSARLWSMSFFVVEKSKRVFLRERVCVCVAVIGVVCVWKERAVRRGESDCSFFESKIKLFNSFPGVEWWCSYHSPTFFPHMILVMANQSIGIVPKAR